MVPTESSQGLMDTAWIGLVQAYTLAPKSRAPSMAVPDGFALIQYDDRPADRRQFIERLEGQMRAEAAATRGGSEIEAQTFQSRHQNSEIVP